MGSGPVGLLQQLGVVILAVTLPLAGALSLTHWAMTSSKIRVLMRFTLIAGAVVLMASTIVFGIRLERVGFGWLPLICGLGAWCQWAAVVLQLVPRLRTAQLTYLTNRKAKG